MTWNNLDEFLNYINYKVEYVILRNWEAYPFTNLLSGKDDMDILCKDKADFINTVDAVPLHHDCDRGNYYIYIGDQKIRIDIRYVGDGYYCREWEEEILKNRIWDVRGFYILDSDDYMFSLLYHALIQKPQFSLLYHKKLNSMFGGERNETEFLYALKEYMDKKHFYVDYPLDKAVFLNMTNIRAGELKIDRDIKKELFRKMFRVSNRISRLYDKIMR